MTLRTLSAAVLGCAALAACADPGIGAKPQALSPMDQFAIQVQPSADEIQLAPRGELSPAQDAALAALAIRWRETGEGPIVIQATAALAASDTAQAVMAALHGRGVPTASLRIAALEGAEAPVKVGFKTYAAIGPQCAEVWGDLTRTAGNGPHASFGCSNTANFAAQIADPRDLVAPQPTSPADSRRRVLKANSYHAGEEPVEDTSGAGSK